MKRRLWLGLVALGLLAGCSDGGPSSTTTNVVGEKIYNRSCFSCHAGGVAGAPVPGDEAAWAPRLAKGREALIQATINGVPPGMPPMGLCTGCTEEDIAAAVDYMLE